MDAIIKYLKNKGYVSKIDKADFITFIYLRENQNNADMVVDYVNGKDLKKLAKEYHIAASRISNLAIRIAETYYSEVLSKNN